MKKIYEPVSEEHIIVDTSNSSKVDIQKIAMQVLKIRP
jgi:hypothetical protein